MRFKPTNHTQMTSDLKVDTGLPCKCDLKPTNQTQMTRDLKVNTSLPCERFKTIRPNTNDNTARKFKIIGGILQARLFHFQSSWNFPDVFNVQKMFTRLASLNCAQSFLKRNVQPYKFGFLHILAFEVILMSQERIQWCIMVLI